MDRYCLKLYDKDGNEQEATDWKWFYDEGEAKGAYIAARVDCKWLPVLYQAKRSGHVVMGRDVPKWVVVASCSPAHPEGMQG